MEADPCKNDWILKETNIPVRYWYSLSEKCMMLHCRSQISFNNLIYMTCNMHKNQSSITIWRNCGRKYYIIVWNASWTFSKLFCRPTVFTAQHVHHKVHFWGQITFWIWTEMSCWYEALTSFYAMTIRYALTH